MQKIVAPISFRFQQLVKQVLLLCLGVMAFACTTIPPPLEEYAIARSALEAARMVDAARFAGAQYHKAMDAYLRAEILYRNREYHEARDLFEAARANFERAENTANVQRKKNGETL